MQIPVAITGIGIISSVGHTVEENYQSLILEKHGIAPLQLISGRHHQKTWVGEVSLQNNELAHLVGIHDERNYSRTSLLGIYAIQQALEQAQISDLNDIAFISATSVAGMDNYEHHYPDFAEQVGAILGRDAGSVTQQIANFIGIKGYHTTISTACSSAANAIMFGARLIQSGRANRVIVGGTDALSKFTLNGFDSLMLLSDSLNRPFDQERKGLNLGEGAAYLVLESEQSLSDTPKAILGYLTGYANANDAFHQTSTSEHGEGAFLAMQEALKKAKLTAAQIGYINAHGTATENNDRTEAFAINRIFQTIPPFSSTKSYTGHTLAASAAIEAVYSLLALQYQQVFPNLRFENSMFEIPLKPIQKTTFLPIQHVLSNSFGFGGNCSTLIFSHG